MVARSLQLLFMSHAPFHFVPCAVACIVSALSSSLACDATKPRVEALPARTQVVAMARDFQDFRAWGYLSLGQRPAQGDTHVQGELRVFVNALPPPGTEQFPVGTMIVKESLANHRAGQPKQHFAMVKRSATFNAQGAKGWEWFELTEDDDVVAIGWRGLGAPDGENYGGDPAGSCNGCHQMAVRNDYVLSNVLQLHH